MPAHDVWERALPVDRNLDFVDPQPSRGGRFIHIRSTAVEAQNGDELEATVRAGERDSRSGRVGYRLRRALIGPALRAYILTVAVSVASGVAAVTSAIPSLTSATVPIGLVVILLLVGGNLRGAREAGAAFAAPTYRFVIAIALIVIVGLVKAGSHGFHPVTPAPHRATEALGVLLVLRAFSSGATAMTGIEVISNAVPVFRPPKRRTPARRST